MRKSDVLFQLIKSMSKSEKRYFKLHAGLHSIGGKNIYLKLFDFIDRMNEYDENLIKEKFKGEKFAKNLFASKNYLFNLILKILTIYRMESTTDSRLIAMLNQSDILFEKGLYKPYKSLLAKAEKLARENEKYYILAMIIEKKAVFILTEFYHEKVSRDMDHLRNDMVEYLDNIRYNFEYKILYNKLFFITKQTDFAVLRGDDDIIDEFISDPLFKDDSKAVTVTAKFYYYSIKSFYYFRKGEYLKCYGDRKKLITLFENEEDSLNKYPRNYMSSLGNLANVCNRLGKYNEAFSAIEKIRRFLKLKYKNQKAYADVWSKLIIPISVSELECYINTCRFDKLENVIKRIIYDVDRYTGKINEPKKMGIYNLVSYACFINGKYNEALEFINRTLNYSNPNPESYAYNVARVFSLIIHYEVSNFELLEYELKNTKKYFIRRRSLYKLEELIIGFLSDALNFVNENETIQRIKRLKQDIVNLIPDIASKKPLEFFDYESWIESKINRRSFKEQLLLKSAN